MEAYIFRKTTDTEIYGFFLSKLPRLDICRWPLIKCMVGLYECMYKESKTHIYQVHDAVFQVFLKFFFLNGSKCFCLSMTFHFFPPRIWCRFVLFVIESKISKFSKIFRVYLSRYHQLVDCLATWYKETASL